MNPGWRIPAFITQLTDITNAMVAVVPAVGDVMRDAARFVGALPVVAHNASFEEALDIDDHSHEHRTRHPPQAAPRRDRCQRAAAGCASLRQSAG
jgi:DNA polymerase III alpha subunit (gram-positive type)